MKYDKKDEDSGENKKQKRIPCNEYAGREDKYRIKSILAYVHMHVRTYPLSRTFGARGEKFKNTI